VKRETLYEKAIQEFGEKSQVLMLLEEMSELQKAILKSLREPFADYSKEIIDEVSDVEITLEQVKYMLGINKKVYARKKFKKARLKKLLERLEER
jgi:hypothetical protein